MCAPGTAPEMPCALSCCFDVALDGFLDGWLDGNGWALGVMCWVLEVCDCGRKVLGWSLLLWRKLATAYRRRPWVPPRMLSCVKSSGSSSLPPGRPRLSWYIAAFNSVNFGRDHPNLSSGGGGCPRDRGEYENAVANGRSGPSCCSWPNPPFG